MTQTGLGRYGGLERANSQSRLPGCQSRRGGNLLDGSISLLVSRGFNTEIAFFKPAIVNPLFSAAATSIHNSVRSPPSAAAFAQSNRSLCSANSCSSVRLCTVKMLSSPTPNARQGAAAMVPRVTKRRAFIYVQLVLVFALAVYLTFGSHGLAAVTKLPAGISTCT